MDTKFVDENNNVYSFPEDKQAAAIAAGLKPIGEGSAPETFYKKPIGGIKKATVPMRDVATEQDVEVPEGQAVDEKLAAGTHKIMGDTLLKDEDNNIFKFPGDKVADAIKNGLNSLSVEEQHQYELNKEAQSHTSIGEAFVGHGIEHFPFAKTAVNLVDPEGAAQREANLAANKAAHPTASFAGAATGEIGGAIGLGAIGEASTAAAGVKGIVKPILEGAIYASDEATKRAINGDYLGAAEALGAGGLMNVAIHGIFSGAKALGETAEKTATSSLLERPTPEAVEQAQNLVGKKIGLSTAAIADNRSAMMEMLKVADIKETDAPKYMLEKIQALSESGPRIGQAIKQLDTFEEKAPIILTALNEAKKEIRGLMPDVVAKETAAAEVAKTKQALLMAGDAEKNTAARAFNKALQQYEKVGGNGLSPSQKEAKRVLKPILDEINAVTGDGKKIVGKNTFAETQRVKKWIADQTNFTENNAKNSLRRRAYGIFRDAAMGAEDKVAAAIPDPTIHGALQHERAAYAANMIFGTAAERAAAKVLPSSFLQDAFGTHITRHGIAGMATHAVGLPGAIGAGVSIGQAMVRPYVERNALKGAVKTLLTENAYPNNMMVMHAISEQKKNIADGAKDLVSHLFSGKTLPALITYSGIKHFLPNNGIGISSNKQLTVLRDAVNKSPEAFAEHMGTLTDPLRKEGLPEVADAYTQHTLRLMKVLQTILPKDNSTLHDANPFTANVDINEISPATKMKYQRALEVANDPNALLDMIKNNTISAGDVAIAGAVNPSTLTKMRQALMEEMIKTKPDLSYQQRLSLGTFMGTQIDMDAEQMPVIQSVYGAVAPSGSNGIIGQGKKSSMGSKSGENLKNSYLTNSEKSLVGK